MFFSLSDISLPSIIAIVRFAYYMLIVHRNHCSLLNQ